MGFIAFVKGLFAPPTTAELLEREKEREAELMRQVLVVMAKHRREDPNDMLSLRTLYSELNMRAQELIDTMRALVDAGFVQRLDGGNKDKTPWECHYVINNDGLNHIRYSGR